MVHKSLRRSPGIEHLVPTAVANSYHSSLHSCFPLDHFTDKPPTSLRLYLWESPADSGASEEHTAGLPPRQGIREGLPKGVSFKLSSEAGVRLV